MRGIYSNALPISTNPLINIGEIISFCNACFYFLYYEQNMGNKSIFWKKFDFSYFNCWICGDGKSITVYNGPYWFESQGVILEPKNGFVKLRVNHKKVAVQKKLSKGQKTLLKVQKTLIALFCGTPGILV